jgi:hypothetical protein
MTDTPKLTVWMAYYSDWSDFAIFETEIEALRHAVKHEMHVKELTLPATGVRSPTPELGPISNCGSIAVKGNIA